MPQPPRLYARSPYRRPPAPLPTYVAIAYSPSDGIYGWANNASTRGDAENAAMSYCVQYGGADCQVAA